MGNDKVKNITLQPGETIPIHMETLKNLESMHLKRKTSKFDPNFSYSVEPENTLYKYDEDEHRLGISIDLRSETYITRETIPFDREGNINLDMVPSNNHNRGRVKDYSNVPYINTSISMKGDGGREVTFSSIYSIKNETSRPFQVKLMIKGISPFLLLLFIYYHSI